MATVCLTMIVKNEAHVLAKALASALPFIDCAVIVDTGSTDETEKVAMKALRNVDGVFVEHPWRGFGDARTSALQYARGRADYALVIDADETLHGKRPKLSAPSHAVWHVNGTTRFRSFRYLRIDCGWRYEREIHEYPIYDKQQVDDGKTLDCVHIETTSNGARSQDPQKYRRDARLIEELIATSPDDASLYFYLAQSYRDAGDDGLAAGGYLRRAEMGGAGEEPYIALIEAGRALGRLSRFAEAEETLLRARAAAPYRCEAPALLACLYDHIARNTPPVGGMNVETCHYLPDVVAKITDGPIDHPYTCNTWGYVDKDPRP